MSYYQYAREQYEQPKENLDDIWQERLVEWRQEEKIKNVDNPTRISKARTQGYKAKKGLQNRYSSKKSKRVIAEQRTSKKYPNLEVLDSYWVAEDGDYKWYEVIMVDPEHPEIQNDNDINWICDKQSRAERGLTPAGKKSRGLQNRGKGAEKVRPSQSANDGRTK
ncbi:MAG: 50S ribosomal protein L15e [Nanohaloarchaea archaeon SW_4_43_9]|nr:ribosomal protein L15 [uncultured archaeon]PSG99641.1 MAG: 50S ribosomal protein L15e [Nanohaloarchaea archaeon SW_4_43_9]